MQHTTKNKAEATITGKIYFEAILTNTSPLRIGNGEGEVTDLCILKDKSGNPYISGTTLGGVLKNHFYNTYDLYDVTEQNQLDYFFGADEISQSHFIVDDSYIIKDRKIKIRVRDGVRIDPRKGTTIPSNKFDYETLDPGYNFIFKGEITIRTIFDAKLFKEIIQLLLQDLQQEKNIIQIGSLTNNGFGNIKLNSIHLQHFDFSKEGALEYFTYLENPTKKSLAEFKPTESIHFKRTEKKNLSISLSIDNQFALLMGANPEKDDKEDKISFKIGDTYYLPGSGFKGALRHRALKILKTLNIDNSESLVNQAFGTGKDNGVNDKEIKGKIKFEETLITDTVGQFQPRVKINRFLKSAVNGGLFNAKFAKQGNINTILEIKNYADWEIWLLLMVLKDLIHEDLAVGGNKNIGYGRFTGIISTINNTDSKEWIKNNLNQEFNYYYPGINK